jgi:probable F420-dependent oxidoreductase
VSRALRIDAIAPGVRTRDVATAVGQAERAGFDGLWFTESGVPVFDLCVAAALTGTQLHLGTGIAVAFPRAPMLTAQHAWDLAELTQGRFTLGIGTQVKAHIERRYGAAYSPPGPRMREYVLALRAIFDAFQKRSPLAFEGEFWSMDLLPDAWSPGPIDWPDVPVHVAVVRPWMCRMAGAVADGIHCHPFHSVEYLRSVVLPAVAEGAGPAGRSVEVVVPVMVATGGSSSQVAKAREEARARIAFYGSTRTYGVVFEQHGWHGVSERLWELQRSGDLAGMTALITDEMVDVFAVTGDWSTVGPQLVERYGGWADRLVMYSATPNVLARDADAAGWRSVVAHVHGA